jgi:outer membrane protein TolC
MRLNNIIEIRQNGKVLSVLLFCLFAFLPLSAQQSYTLQQLKDSALHNNIAIRTAEHNIDAAHQQRREAFTKYFPTVSATGITFNANQGMAKMEMNPSEMIPAEMGTLLSQMLPAQALAALASPISMTMMKNGTIASVTAVQPVFAGGQIVNGNRLARVGEDVAALQLQLSQQEVEHQTEQYYWQLVTLYEKMHTIDAVDSLLANIYNNVDVAVRAGVALRNDLLQVQLRQNDIASQRLRLRNAISTLRLLVAQYCGLCDTSFVVAQQLPSHQGQSNALLPSHQGEGLGVGSVSSLPEYRLLEKQVEATTLQRRLAIGQNLPTVAVGAGYNYHNLMDNDRSFAMIFATVSVPISQWWGGSHAIRRSSIELQKAEEQLTDNAQLLSIRMQHTANAVEEAHQQWLLAQQAVEQADENLRIHNNQYTAGTVTMSALLEAQLLAQQAHDKLTEAYANLMMAQLECRQARGE